MVVDHYHGIKTGFDEHGSRTCEILATLDHTVACQWSVAGMFSDPDVVFLCSFPGSRTAGRGRRLRRPHQGART